jgi:MoxR-like ATPase
VRPDEVKRLAPAILSHRLILSSQARLRGRAAEQALTEILESVPVPVEAIESGESQTIARGQQRGLETQ